MTKRLLLILFLALLASHAVGLETGLGPGLSIKNALIYAVATVIAIEGAVAGNRKIQLLSVFLPFGLLIFYAILSWAFIVIFADDPNYSARETLIRLKTKLVDQAIVLFVFYYGVVNREDALALMKKVIWAVILGCLITVVDTYNIPDLGIVGARDDDGRIEGIIGAAAEFGGLLAFYVPPVFALALSSYIDVGSIIGISWRHVGAIRGCGQRRLLPSRKSRCTNFGENRRRFSASCRYRSGHRHLLGIWHLT
jgi:hypothetical protein